MAIFTHLPFGRTAKIVNSRYLYQPDELYPIELQGRGQPVLPFSLGGVDYCRSYIANGPVDVEADRSEVVITKHHPNDSLRYVGFGISLPSSTPNNPACTPVDPSRYPLWQHPRAWGCVFQVLQKGNPGHAPYSPAVSLNFGTHEGRKCLFLVGRGDGGYKVLHRQPLDGQGSEWMFNRVFQVLVGFDLKNGKACVTYHRPWDKVTIGSGFVDHKIMLTGPQTDGQTESIVKFGLYTSSQAFGGEYWANFVNVKYTQWYGEAKSW